MVLGRLIAGGLLAAAGAKLLSSPQTHDQLVESTYNELHRISDTDEYLYVDYHHYNPSNSAGNTRSMTLDTDEHYPDLVLTSSGKQYIVEVETNADALNTEARSQLRDFRLSGFTRMLVVPHDHLDAAERFVDDLEGTVEVASPKMLSAAN